MQDFESLAHVRWNFKYHVVFIPKYRRKCYSAGCEMEWDGYCGIFAIRRAWSYWRGMRCRTAGRDEAEVRRYIREQEIRDRNRGELFE